MSERLVIVVDWSASSAPGPATPSADQCWVAHGEAPAEYFRTRAACVERVAWLLGEHRGVGLVGFDFAMGYPLLASGEAVLPAGRGLAALLGERIRDRDDNANNRFEVAARLNVEIARRLGLDAGPYWGCTGAPPDGLSRTRRASGVAEFRRCELELRDRGLRPQSAWKLAYPASVGSQTLTGMARLHGLVESRGLRDRCWFWPFEEEPDREDAIAIAEVWPGLFSFEHVDHPVKDARQVVATREALKRVVLRPARDEIERREGAILGSCSPLQADPDL